MHYNLQRLVYNHSPRAGLAQEIASAREHRFPIYIGIDPGVHGALAVLDEFGCTKVEDFTTFGEMFDMLCHLGRSTGIQMVAIEQQWVRPRDGRKASTSYMQHVGGWKSIVELLGLPVIFPQPRDWMKRRVRAKRDKKDKPSVEYVSKKYPGVSLHGPRGGLKDGRSDAICIAEYAKEFCSDLLVRKGIEGG